MSRKIWLLAGVAAALGLFGIQGAAAQAAEFHCSFAPCRITAKADGTGTTAHHVITILGKNTKGSAVSLTITCEKMTGEGEAATTTTSEIVIHPEYANCNIGGVPATPSTIGCFYGLGASGSFKVICEPGAEITFNAKGCIFGIVGQVMNGVIPYTNILSEGKAAETTAAIKAKSVSGMTYSKNCDEVFGIDISSTNTWIYETGNVILTGESTKGVMGNFTWG